MMHDSGMIPFYAGIGIGIRIKKIKTEWNRNLFTWMTIIFAIVESESESHLGRNRASLVSNGKSKTKTHENPKNASFVIIILSETIDVYRI